MIALYASWGRHLLRDDRTRGQRAICATHAEREARTTLAASARADETVRFAFGGAEYEIDLSTKHATAFRKKLAPSSSTPAWPGAASRAAPPRGRQRSGNIRAWAKVPGIGISECGRIPAQRDRAIPAAADTGGHRATGARPDEHAPRRPDAPHLG